MNHRMNRRDFIKFAGILPLLPVSNQTIQIKPGIRSIDALEE